MHKVHLKDIVFPSDLRKLDEKDLPAICAEIREFIIQNLSANPGHFASSMGAVEIATALHYVFNTPRDRIVWDVGHQAYAHKILTGRRDKFSTLRKMDGLSGFPNPHESEYDTFVAGHASNSISAALGMAIADMESEENRDRKTVAVIGDASISGGLAFEGLNNAAAHKNNLLIILNDNNMSIDDNVGALHRYLSGLTTSEGYNRWRDKIYRWMKSHGLFAEKSRGRMLRFNNSLKALISGNQNMFEGLNIRYFGPFDGHDIGKIIKVLREIKDMEGPRILHLRTRKGKGFDVAEKNPSIWHAPGKFNPETGERKKSTAPTANIPKWQNVFGKTLVKLADNDSRIVGITAAMLSGTSMSDMMAKYPERTFDTGISEGHAVTFAGGLAAAGKHPFVAIYSSFLQRAYDNIIHDVAIQGLPVTFCIDRAGLVGEDGVTHHGLFDLAYLRIIPGLTIASPMDGNMLSDLMLTASDLNSPMAIRYPRGQVEATYVEHEAKKLEIGKGRVIRTGEKGLPAILSIGAIGHDVEVALTQLESEGINISHYDMIWLKPLDEEMLKKVANEHDVLITIEDGVKNGGFGSAVLEALNRLGYNNNVITLGAPDDWVSHATVEQLKERCGYNVDAIKNTIKSELSKLVNRKD